MSDPDLVYLPATEALARFRAGTLSPVDLMQAVIDRAESQEPTINAFTFTHYDRALDQARASEARYAAGRPLGPLDGLPVAIKDESYIAGEPTSSGSLLMRDFVPQVTSPVNQRILDAGGIVHARTATPEFSCAAFTWSRLWGVTRNPWNPDYTPGGSSGGSAASLAAGTSMLATGSDIGGSIRIPASACGLVGYKPPYGRNPEDAPFNLDFYCHAGPLARCVADTILFQNVMCGPHPQDIATLRPKLELPYDYPSVAGMKLAYSPDLGFYEVDAEVRANTEKALDVFRELGASVEEVDLGWEPAAFQVGVDYLAHLFGGYLAAEAEGRFEDLAPYTRRFLKSAGTSTSIDFVRSLSGAGEMYATLGPILETYDALICPTTALPAVAADFDETRTDLTINGKTVNPMLGWVMTSPFNTLSRCPVLSVPSGRSTAGVPTGIQIVGRTYCDEDVFRLAAGYEAAVGPWYGPGAARPANGAAAPG